jgi:hypothetical protein
MEELIAAVIANSGGGMQVAAHPGIADFGVWTITALVGMLAIVAVLRKKIAAAPYNPMKNL